MREQGYSVIIAHSNELFEEEENTSNLFHRRVDDLIISLSNSGNNIDHINQFEEKKLAVIFIDRVPKKCKNIKVVIDNYKCGYQATQHLHLSLFGVNIGNNIGFACVHPPGIDALAVNFFVDHVPKSFSCISIESIIKGRNIPPTNPIFLPVGDVPFEQPTLLIKFIVSGNAFIKFWPHRDHDLRVIFFVQHINHAIRRSKTIFVKLLASPSGFLPIAPVQYNIINGYFSFSECINRRKNFILRFIVESRKVFHPCVLTEPCVTVSRHTALPVLNHKMYCYIMDVPIASVGISGAFPYTFVAATLQRPSCTGFSPI